MTEILQLWRIDFCNMENNSARALSRELVASFVGDGTVTASGKLSEFVKTIEPVKLYDGWGFPPSIYPRYEVTREFAK